MLVLEYHKFGSLAGLEPLFLVAFLKKTEETAEFMRGKRGHFRAAHVPDVLEKNPSGFELYSPKTRFLIARQRHFFKLIDPNVQPQLLCMITFFAMLNHNSFHNITQRPSNY